MKVASLVENKEGEVVFSVGEGVGGEGGTERGLGKEKERGEGEGLVMGNNR